MSESFAALGVPAPIVKALAARRITEPTPIQAATVRPGLDRLDVCGRAPTGSGKTIAFGIPLVVDLTPAKPRKPRALVLAPTRELADQIADELELLGAPLGVSVLAVYGGVGYGGQRAVLKRGVDVVVACPGRLEDLIGEKTVDLRRVERVVLDEADRMADMGFVPSVRRILDACAPDRQTTMFSATLDGAVDEIRRRYQRDPVLAEVDDASAEPDLEHVVRPVEREERIAAAAETVRAHGSTIVFCRTKRGADRVATQLGKHGVKAAAIHGDRSQGQRTRALEAFAAGKVDALVATDVAARGIHVDDVACVVHYDPPGDQATYVHRSGRTGRAGKTGVVVSLVLDAEQRREAAKVLKALGVDATDGRVPARAAGSAATTPVRPARPERGRQASERPRRADDRPSRLSHDGGARSTRGRGDHRDAKPRGRDRDAARPAGPTEHQGPRARRAAETGLRGSVKFYDRRRGFGFLLHDGRDLFFHKSQVTGRLAQGQDVRFHLGTGPRGEEAQQVSALG